jgi:hypothetical protein
MTSIKVFCAVVLFAGCLSAQGDFSAYPASPLQGVEISDKVMLFSGNQASTGSEQSQVPVQAGDTQRVFGNNDGDMVFTSQRKRRFRSNTDGKLIIDNDRIMFESLDNYSDSRRWEMREIRELKLKNPFEIEIRTTQEKYNLLLSGAGMDNAQFREISTRVTRARTAR